MTATLIDNETARQFDRLPPSSVKAERSLLAAAMHSNTVEICELRALVAGEDFYQADNQIIWDEICELADTGKNYDATIVSESLRGKQQLEYVGGDEYLQAVLRSDYTSAFGAHYAAIVVEKAKLRRMISAANETLRRCYAPLDNNAADEIAESALKAIGEVTAAGKAGLFHKIGDVAQEVFDTLESGGKPLLTTGIGKLDASVGGIQGGEMVVVAARPSMGKSTLAKVMARGIVETGAPVRIVSLEERRDKIVRNMLSAEAMIENRALRTQGAFGKGMTREQWQTLGRSVGQFGKLPIYISDRARSMRDIRALCSVMVRRFGVKAIIIDYLQRIQCEGKDRYEKATNASLGVSDMLKDLDVAGIVMAQLNREVGHRDGNIPTMTDLRESGQIEQDADGIILLHRADYYKTSDPNHIPSEIAELIIAKWRDSARGGVVKLTSDLRHQRFFEDPMKAYEEVP